MKNLTDNELIKIAKDRLNKYTLAKRMDARGLLRARGYRFVGDRVEREAREPEIENRKTENEVGEGFHDIRFTNNDLRILKGGTMATKFKGYHKPCKNHPDKYAWKDGLCWICVHERDGVIPYRGEKRPKPGKADQVLPLQKDNETGEKIVIARAAPRDADNIVTLDFTEHKALYAKLIKSAEEDFRTPEMQCMSILKTAIAIAEKYA